MPILLFDTIESVQAINMFAIVAILIFFKSILIVGIYINKFLTGGQFFLNRIFALSVA